GVQVSTDPAVEEQLRVAVGVQGPLAARIVDPTEPARSVESGRGRVDHRDAPALSQFYPPARVFEVVAQHLRDIGLEHVGPGPDVEDRVERWETTVESLHVPGIDREVVEEVGDAQARDAVELLRATSERVHHEDAVASAVVQGADEA